jgi:hypothetical protein
MQTVVIRIRQTVSFGGRRRSKLSVPLESLAPTKESLRWAHHPVGYDWPWREKPRPFPIKILRSAHRLPRVADGFRVSAFLRMTVIVHDH